MKKRGVIIILAPLILIIAVIMMAFTPVKHQISKKAPKNIIFILADDHRYDAMGFMNKFSGLQTPNLDQMAAEGAHIQNAFVSTALCSPSRASILTGQYAHTHTIVDNQAPMPKGLTFFPEYLQKKGYKTAFFGKWHMGNTDDSPQPGFNHWVSFRGQGVYYNPTFNVNGKQVAHKDSSYISDLLTDYTLNWLNQQDKRKPFFVYLSHKAVHAEFQPAERHRGKYHDMPIQYPASMYLTKTDSSKIWGQNVRDPEVGPLKSNILDIPNWVKKQRYSWHGVDYMYHGQIGFNDFYKSYCETLLGVDESVGRVMQWLKDNGLDENTLVIYMGDNGFSFGERGLIDKRHAYEESMRVPLLARCPALVKGGTKISQVIQNIDIAPTLLDYAGITAPKQMQGKSFLPILSGQSGDWRNQAFYEYYWEYDFPQTPTMFAVRTDRYKYIFNYGNWDINELYDLQEDPEEVNNLIRSPEHQKIAEQLRKELFDWLETSGGDQIPVKRPLNRRFDNIYRGIY
ncbi:MAG: sulfatase [Saprospiraceae bacterium]|nr:sulfatase [Saprospiraceae bacterium]